MKKHGFRSIFSLLLAVMMVCSMLPTAAFAEGDVEEQSVVEETYTVTYADGMDGAAFAEQKTDGLLYGNPTPAFAGEPALDGYTFTGWDKEIAATVTESVTYTAQWQEVQQEAQSDVQPEADGNGEIDMQKGPDGQPPLNSDGGYGDPSHWNLDVGDGMTWEPAESKYVVNNANSTVVLHPSVNSTVTGVKVSVGGTLSGYTIKNISGYDITVDLGKYNVNNGSFRLPYAKDIWYGVDNNKVDYISWAGSGSNRRSEGGSALLANGKNTAYYYFKGVPVMPTFTLNYDANGGTGAPASQTYKATSQYERPHTFTISSQVPTRDGHTFLGWSTDSKATAATYQPSGSINVTSTTTLYAVWQENTPPAPGKDQVANLYRGAVTVKCTNESAGHGSKSYDLTEGDITGIGTPSKVNDNLYSCDVTIASGRFVAQFNAEKGNVAHEPANTTKTAKVYYANGIWFAPSNDDGTIPIVFEVACNAQPKPDKPGAPENLSNLIGPITVKCTNDKATHEPKSKGYALIENSYTTTGVEVDTESGYTYTVTISPEKYVEQFGTDTKVTHTTEDGNATVVLEYKDNAWAVKSGTPVSFNAKCETVTPPTGKPEAPTDEDLKNLNVPPVDVECTTKEEHTASYELLKDSYGIGDVVGNESGSYTCDVTVYAEEYVKEFCKTKYGPHLLDGNDKETLTLKYVDGKWVTVGWVTFNVKCVVPAKPTEDDLAGIKVFVQCTNSGATHGDKRKEYGLIGTDGYYYVGNPTFLESDGKYHCTVNVNGDRYVAKYSTDTGVPHTYMSVDTVYKYAYLTATWTDGGYVWSVDKDGSTVTFEAWCETVPPAQTFTVTYKDGVAGKAFQDQSYTVPSGSATPAFNGTPYLAGYVFTDWAPAVATTVTANATYIATWKLDTNNNGKPDDEEERYTVTYVDGAGGKAFADQVYTGLLSGTSTPKFDGTPVRSGYVFIGWSPVWSGTVTGNVTYTATWSTITGGLDKVPKTGDNGLTLALSALLLFSFCGAAACVVSTKKRG